MCSQTPDHSDTMHNLGFSKDVSIDVLDDVLDNVIDQKRSECKIEEKYWIAKFNVEKLVCEMPVPEDNTFIAAQDKSLALRASTDQRRRNSMNTLGKSLKVC